MRHNFLLFLMIILSICVSYHSNATISKLSLQIIDIFPNPASEYLKINQADAKKSISF